VVRLKQLTSAAEALLGVGLGDGDTLEGFVKAGDNAALHLYRRHWEFDLSECGGINLQRPVCRRTQYFLAAICQAMPKSEQ